MANNCQIYPQRQYAYMIGSFILSYNSKVTLFWQRVDTRFSHGYGTMTEHVNITKPVTSVEEIARSAAK